MNSFRSVCLILHILMDGWTDGRMDGWTDRPTDQRTKPVIEIQFIEKKKLCIL